MIVVRVVEKVMIRLMLRELVRMVVVRWLGNLNLHSKASEDCKYLIPDHQGTRI